MINAKQLPLFEEDRTEYPCLHCGVIIDIEESPDYYMVEDHLWEMATASLGDGADEGMLHWDCLSTRLMSLGHQLTLENLTDVPVNVWFRESRDDSIRSR